MILLFEILLIISSIILGKVSISRSFAKYIFLIGSFSLSFISGSFLLLLCSFFIDIVFFDLGDWVLRRESLVDKLHYSLFRDFLEIYLILYFLIIVIFTILFTRCLIY